MAFFKKNNDDAEENYHKAHEKNNDEDEDTDEMCHLDGSDVFYAIDGEGCKKSVNFHN